MKLRVFKYPVAVLDEQVLKIPGLHKILSIGEQPGIESGVLMLWAMVDLEDKTTDEVPLRIVGTGNPMPDDMAVGRQWKYWKTVQMASGLVWHVFLKAGELL